VAWVLPVRHAILELVARRVKAILATSLAIVSEAIVMAASRSAVTGGRYYDQPNRDQLDLDALVGRIGWDSGLGVSGRRGRSTSADQATRTGWDTGLELVSRQDGSKPGGRANGTGWDTGPELLGRHRRTPGDRATRTGQDTGLELVRRQDRSAPGDRRDNAPEVVRTPVANHNRDRRSAKQVGRSAMRHRPWEPHAGRRRTAKTQPPGAAALRHRTEKVPLALER
jgi:hypothetical protein